MTSTTVAVPAEDGSEFDVYVSAAGSGSRPGLIICSEAFGVNSHMRSVADRFATEGFITAVPDLFWRLQPAMEIPYNEAGLRRASEIADAFDKEQGVEDVRPVLKALRARSDCNGKVGVLGFCIGGTVAYLAAARLSVDAFVSYYGKGIENFLTEVDAVTCPGVLHYAGADRFIPKTMVDAVRGGIASSPQIEIYVYPGVDHGFNSEDRPAYAPKIANKAMERTLRVLNGALKTQNVAGKSGGH